MAERRPEDTCFLLVTCSRDESRADLAAQVIGNLNALLGALHLADRFAVFDNASTFDAPLAAVDPNATLIRADRNAGYWSAIHWVLENLETVYGRSYEFIYIVESDLYHSALAPLGLCESFLRTEPRAAAVRTQEFRVASRWRFDKRFHWLPGHITRSEVHLRNAVTKEKVWFEARVDFPGLYLTNFHAKLPALNRVAAMRDVFAALAHREAFAEGDFFVEMAARHPLTGLYDGGLFHSLLERGDKRFTSGSYSDSALLATLGYQETRTGRIGPVGDVRIVHGRAKP